MKNFYTAISPNKVWIIALVVIMAACSQFEAIDPDKATLEQSSVDLASAFSLDSYGLGLENARVPSTGTASAPKSTGGITPYIIPGEGSGRDCGEVATAYGIPSFGISFEGRETPFLDNKSTFTGADGAVITAITDGTFTFVSWSIEVPAGYCVKYLAAVLKGGPNANVYFYEGDISSDSGLASPTNLSGGPFLLSDLRFCYTLEKKPDAPEVEGDEACDKDGLVLKAKLKDSSTTPEGYNLQWYTKNDQGEFEPVPGNDPKLDEVGSKTYYAAFVNACTSNMSEGAVLTINPLPAEPISGGDQVGDCNDILTATVKDVPDGITIVWYDKDGNIVDDPSLSYDESIGGDQTATFYAEAVDDKTKCASAERTKVTLTLRPCPDDEPCYEWKGETAWAAGSKYNIARGGNWATFTSRDALKDGEVKLFAGQTMLAGYVNAAGTDDGKYEITITLVDGWRFKAGTESVKIQDYASAPSGNPSPGGFAWKNAVIVGNTATITVLINEFYGIHVDVEKRGAQIECPLPPVTVD